jgi:hypothetical protein
MFKMNKTILKIILVSHALGLLACGEKTTLSYTDAPWLDFECSFVSALTCDAAANSKTAYFGLSESTDLDCRSHIDGLSTPNWPAAFDYFTHTQTNLIGGVVTGIASNWVNRLEMPVIQLPTVPLRVCGFIDLNGNNQADINEPFLQGELTPGQDFLPFSNWDTF